MQYNPVGWFEIYVQDMPRAKAFYEAVFEVRLEQLSSGEVEMWAFPMIHNAPGAMGALAKMDGVASGGNSTLVYFGSADCGVVAERAKKNGAEIVRDKFSIGEHGFIALVKDTEGNLIGLHSMQ